MREWLKYRESSRGLGSGSEVAQEHPAYQNQRLRYNRRGKQYILKV